MAIFITGDTHGDFTRFKKKIFYEQAELNKDDNVIICGDFGGIWDGSAEERHWLDWLEAKPYTTLFVSGNHENFDMLAEYPIEDWHGGKVQHIRPSVIHLMRGQIYDIQGKTIFTMGGASSHDIDGGILEPDDPLLKKKCRRLDASGALYRINHRSWWKEELPSEEEYQTARATLDRAGWTVDYIITHCCPTSVQDELSGGLYKADTLTDFLDEVAQRCQFSYQFLDTTTRTELYGKICFAIRANHQTGSVKSVRQSGRSIGPHLAGRFSVGILIDRSLRKRYA